MTPKNNGQKDSGAQSAGEGTFLPAGWFRQIRLVDRTVVGIVLVQVVGYAALSALVPHGEFSALVEPLQRVPVVVLIPVSILAIPAVVLALVFGALLSIVGLRPTTVSVLLGMYVIGVGIASLWAHRKRAHRASRPA